MEFEQIRGNTWAFYSSEVLPIYLLGDGKCILMDTGYPDERQKLELALQEHGLTPQGVLCSHAHIDHIGSGAYFQNKYKIPLIMSQGEGGILSNLLNCKAYRMTLSPEEAVAEMSDCVSEDIQFVSGTCSEIEVANVKFMVYHTPGHSADHLCFGTGDGVCYLGDALLSDDQLEAKLPYALDIAKALESHKTILDFPEDLFVLAHRGVVEKKNLVSLVKANQDLFLQRAMEIRRCTGGGKTMDQLCIDYCKEQKLNTRKPKRIAVYQRNIRFFLEFLEDIGEVSIVMGESGILWKSNVPKDLEYQNNFFE